MSTAEPDRLQKAVLARVREVEGERRLLCADALALADELGVPAAEIGQLCNREGIKIRSCQLGCF